MRQAVHYFSGGTIMEAKNPFINSKWITPNDENCQSPIIQRKFTLEKVSQATLFITGLGYFEARINGVNVTEDLLIPVASDYENRHNYDTYYYPIFDTFTYRIYYCRYDVTHLLKAGQTNTIAAWVTTGWWNGGIVENRGGVENAFAAKLILTYDENALGFYTKLGFQADDSYKAKNDQNVIVKKF